jgi:hypothetical protein
METPISLAQFGTPSGCRWSPSIHWSAHPGARAEVDGPPGCSAGLITADHGTRQLDQRV